MRIEMMKRWNKKVKPNDTVIVLGDFSQASKEETKGIVGNLNGYKILVMGNHDTEHSIQWWYDVGFDEVSYRSLVIGSDIFSHEPPSVQSADTYFYIYAHVHLSENYKTITANTACASVVRWEFTLVALDELHNLAWACRKKETKLKVS